MKTVIYVRPIGGTKWKSFLEFPKLAGVDGLLGILNAMNLGNEFCCKRHKV